MKTIIRIVVLAVMAIALAGASYAQTYDCPCAGAPWTISSVRTSCPGDCNSEICYADGYPYEVVQQVTCVNTNDTSQFTSCPQTNYCYYFCIPS